jgi:hypothetical protein
VNAEREPTAPARAVASVTASRVAASAFRGVLRTLGDWLPIAAAAALVALLSWLGLRPVLAERVRLESARERVGLETRVLAAEASEVERLERATEDPLYQERLRWQWRLGDRAPREVEARGSDERTLPMRGERVDATPIDDESVLQSLVAPPSDAAPSQPSAAAVDGRVR